MLNAVAVLELPYPAGASNHDEVASIELPPVELPDIPDLI